MSLELIHRHLSPQQAQAVLRFWPILNASEKELLLNQIQNINLTLLEKQIELLKVSYTASHFEAFTNYSFAGNQENSYSGKDLIKKGRVGCIIMAGGHGTRLGFEGPKGLYPASNIRHKSLFQLCFEKVLAAGKQVGCDLSIAVMTSLENDASIRQFLNEHHFFGLNSGQVSFFTQNNLPLLDANGHLFLESMHKISEGPDGNGYCLHRFFKSGLGAEWKQNGIKIINLILIDNPLADPFDAELVGFHNKNKVDVTLKCTEKLYPEEKVGVVVEKEGFCRVIEYSELNEHEKNTYTGSHLKHCCANLSLFSFSMDFIQKVVESHPLLPLHKAWKATKFVDEKGVAHRSPQPMAWKFENYIFDVLNYTSNCAALLYPREQCFAPLKNSQGQDSIQTVQEALLKRDRAVLQSITGLEPPKERFELAAEFYYPTVELLAKWKGREAKESYVEP